MRLIELWAARRGAARADLVRCRNTASLRFPASEVQAIGLEPRELPSDAHGLAKALQDGSLRRIELVPAFAGLTGAAGALPVHYTERLAAHTQTHKDGGPQAFLDLFADRSLALFYQGWRKYRLELSPDLDQGGGLLPLLLALAGLGHAALRRRLQDDLRGQVLDESLAHFACALRQRPAATLQMARVLGAYFDAPIRIEQFVGAWYAVPPAQQTRLGMQSCALGGGALAGDRVWQRNLRMRVVIGPLDHAAFDSFLPGGIKARALRALLAMFTGATLDYEVQLVLRAADVRGAALGAPSEGGMRLGWDGFLAPPAKGPDRADVRYELMAPTN